MCDKIRKISGSLLFWFLISLVTFIAMTTYHHTLIEHLDWKAAYNLTSLFLRGFLLSSMFYFLVIYRPSKRKRTIIKNNLKSVYKKLKKEMIREILWCSQQGGRTDIKVTDELVDKLYDTTNFWNFFKGGKEANEGWYAFLNHIQNNPDDFSRLLCQLKMLAKQLDFILHNYEIKSQEHFDFFKQLELTIINLNTLTPEAFGDEMKTFSRFLWDLLAGKAPLTNHRDYDIVDRFIDEI